MPSSRHPSTHPLMVVIICGKYGNNRSRTENITERTRFSKSRSNDLEDIWLRYGRNTAEHTTWLGTTGPQVTLEFKCPQTEMPHPDDACIGVMTTEKWRHNDVRGPLAGLPERSHHTLWCTCTAVSESPGHFLISWFAVDPHRAKTGRVERQSLWEGVPWQIYQWSAGLLISPSLPKPH